ncbi:MAG: hypoxanthine phosphoribosyltransferase [Dehalococcoidia bacterium]
MAEEPATRTRRPRSRRRTSHSQRPPQPEGAASSFQAQETPSPDADGTSEPPAVAEPAAAPARPRRRRRGGRGRRRRNGAAANSTAVAPTEAAEAPAPAPAEAAPIKRRHRRRPRGGARPEAETKPPDIAPGTRFAHPSEAEFAAVLDFYGIQWDYEPRSFPLRWEGGHIAEAFTPDFFLPDLNLYVEVTTLKTGLTADKNRKVRLLKQLYPEVNVKLLKKRDLLRLLTKYGYGPLAPEEVPDIDRILIPTTRLQQRVAELGVQISRDYEGKEPVMVGVLRGVLCFLGDLIRQVNPPIMVDFMAISSYEGDGGGAVKILKDLDENIKGRDVILVEDIVDTGMTLNHLLDYLWTKKPASLKVCALLDKRIRRLTNVEIDYVGFEVPDEFVVGYGLDFRQRYRNLPFIAVLKHELLP